MFAFRRQASSCVTSGRALAIHALVTRPQVIQSNQRGLVSIKPRKNTPQSRSNHIKLRVLFSGAPNFSLVLS
jgi:hypothetical protein